MSEKQTKQEIVAAQIEAGMPWVLAAKPALFYEPISEHPIEVKLANMKAAISAGADVNELDQNWRGCHRGRPLYHVMDTDRIYPEVLKDHLPLVKLLLEHGADPRLTGHPNAWDFTPMDEARGALRESHFEIAWPFFKEALYLMKQVADRLDAQDAAKSVAKEGGKAEQNTTAQRSSFLNRFKLW